MIIRQFKKQDAPDVCDVISACITAETTLDAQSRFQLLSENDAFDFYTTVKDDYVLVGALYGQIVAVGALNHNEIHHIYVSPDYRGNGFGETLMLALEAEANANSVEIIRIKTPTTAIAFYEELGYATLNHAHTKIGVATVEMVHMSKYISKFAGV